MLCLPFPVGSHAMPKRGAKFGKRSEEHTSELQSRLHLVCRLLLEKKKGPEDVPVGDRAQQQPYEVEPQRDRESIPTDGRQLVEKAPDRVTELAHVSVNLPHVAAVRTEGRRRALAAHLGGGGPLPSGARLRPRDVRRRAPAPE